MPWSSSVGRTNNRVSRDGQRPWPSSDSLAMHADREPSGPPAGQCGTGPLPRWVRLSNARTVSPPEHRSMRRRSREANRADPEELVQAPSSAAPMKLDALHGFITTRLFLWLKKLILHDDVHGLLNREICIYLPPPACVAHVRKVERSAALILKPCKTRFEKR